MRFTSFVGLALASAVMPANAAHPAADCRHLPTPPATHAATNENQSRAGTLRDGVLTLKLVARPVAWRPDGPQGCALSVNAFAEDEKSPQIPGPLIRVAAGTEVRVTVHNTLPKALWMRGLQDHGLRTMDSVELGPGTSREFRFVASTPGAWYYWGGTAGAVLPMSDVNSQLTGALVVDAPAAGTAPVSDRVMVLTRWTPTGTAKNSGFQINAFNGRSWPNTERLTYTVGDSVHWKVINATDATHEMHLHGFYFRTDTRGFALRDTIPLAAPPGLMRVTGVLRPGEWFSITWSPDRAGNWLYHCHLLTHMSGAQRLDRMPERVTATSTATNHQHDGATGNHAMDDMGGLVLALDVRPARTAGEPRDTTSARRPRVIDIFTGTRPRVFGDKPGHGFIVQEGPTAPAADSIRIPGTPLVLTKGEPVRITVHNRMSIPISVHWHGIELDSYFDGVGGFSGTGTRVAPMIAPRDSFVVRFTPPRAGTFIYHVHGESGEELSSGLYGALLVLEPGATFDPRKELVFVLADGGPGAEPPIFINGMARPDTLELISGTQYRVRMIFISADDIYRSTMRSPTGLATMRVTALDGHDLPGGGGRGEQPWLFPTGPGHTREGTFTPVSPGDYALTIERLMNLPAGQRTFGTPTTLPIRVR
jgi:FtsP/CotA-like multicopper oxidase with cupredoxin domain